MTDDTFIGYPDVQSASARMFRWQAWQRAARHEQKLDRAMSLAAEMDLAMSQTGEVLKRRGTNG